MIKKEKNVTREIALFAGGCFWCVEHAFQGIDGVVSVISGFAGGTEENPTYKEVCSGKTGHVESVKVIFDNQKISYSELLDLFLKHIDPTDPGGQFADRGFHYTTAIFCMNETQRKEAHAALKKISSKFTKQIVTRIVPYTTFYPAEEYHQEYSKKNPLHYKAYAFASGRIPFCKRIWS